MELCDLCIIVLYLDEKKENDIYTERQTDKEDKVDISVDQCGNKERERDKILVDK